jgi:acyl-CoA thioester hydrolase
LNQQQLAGYPVVVRIPVQWGELDAYGHVNNAVFFRYLESARVRYLEICGFIESYERERAGAILHSTSCRFRQPLFYPDTALVGARVTDVQSDRMTMLYAVASESQGALVAEGSSIVVFYDYKAKRPAPIPGEIRARIAAIESETRSQPPA